MHRLTRTRQLRLQLWLLCCAGRVFGCGWLIGNAVFPAPAEAVAADTESTTESEFVPEKSSSGEGRAAPAADDDGAPSSYFQTIPELRFEGRPQPLLVRIARLAAREQRESWMIDNTGSASEAPDLQPLRSEEKSLSVRPRRSSDAELLGRLALAVEDGHLLHAQALSRLVESGEKELNGPLARVFSLLKAEMLFKEGRPSEALELLQKGFKDLQRSFPEKLARLTFRAQVRAGQWASAFATLKASERYLYARDGSPHESGDQIQLALGALESGATREAEELLLRLARSYPVSPVSEKSYALLLSRHDSAEALHNRLWPDAEARVDHAAEIFKKLGLDSPFRSFAFALSGRDPDFKPVASDPDKLTLDEKAALLEEALWFASIREYQPYHSILSYLQRAKVFGRAFPEDRVKFFYARSLNSVNRPLDAADAYASFVSGFPSSSFKGQAVYNNLLSLHYGRRHVEVSRAIDSARVQLRRQDQSLDWLKFWSLYLARENEQAKRWVDGILGRRLSEETRTKYTYWQARILERTGRSKQAREKYQALLTSATQSVYAIYAQWRLNLMDKKPLAAAGSKDLAAKALPRSLIDPQPLTVRTGQDGWGLIGVMTQAGLTDQARKFLAAQKTAGLKPTGLLELAGLAVRAEDFHLASRLGRRALQGTREAAKKGFLDQLADHPEPKRYEYPLAYPRIVSAVTRELDLDPSLVLSIMKAESHYNPDVTSWVGARGLMQIMPGTGTRIANLMGYDGFHPDDLYDPEVNITFGAWYLRRLLTYYKGDLIRAVAAYNAGPVAVDRWSQQTPELELDEFAENVPFQQTHQYVRKVLKFMDVYHRLHMKDAVLGLNLSLPPELKPPDSSLEMF